MVTITPNQDNVEEATSDKKLAKLKIEDIERYRDLEIEDTENRDKIIKMRLLMKESFSSSSKNIEAIMKK